MTRASDDGMPEIPDFLRRPRDTRKAHEILAAADAAIRSMHINTKPGAITMTKTTAAPGPKGEQIKALRTKAAEAAAKISGGDEAATATKAQPQPQTTVSATAPAETPKPDAAAPVKPKMKESSVRTNAQTKSSASPAKKQMARSTERKGAKTAARNAARGQAKKAHDVRPGTKLAIIVDLLKRKEGCTTKDVLAATGWPAVSMPQQAKAAGLVLKKDKRDGVTVYRA